MNEITITKVSDVIDTIRPAQFEAKVAYTQKDDYGNEVTLYRRERLDEANLLVQKKNLEDALATVEEKLAGITATK